MMGTGSCLDARVSASDYGLIPRICLGLFQRIRDSRQGSAECVNDSSSSNSSEDAGFGGVIGGHIGTDYSYSAVVEVSYYEIYNERVFDLLAGGSIDSTGKKHNTSDKIAVKSNIPAIKNQTTALYSL
jgi:hypothetical protein